VGNPDSIFKHRVSADTVRDLVGQISRCKLVQALQKPANVTASVYRTERNTIANTTSQPTMTNDATAPAVILAFSLVL